MQEQEEQELLRKETQSQLAYNMAMANITTLSHTAILFGIIECKKILGEDYSKELLRFNLLKGKYTLIKEVQWEVMA